MAADPAEMRQSHAGPMSRPSKTESALQKRRETFAFNREILLEDILSLYRRGAVPLTIATMVKRSESFVLEVLLEVGEKVPRWLRNDLEGCALGRHEGNEVPPL